MKAAVVTEAGRPPVYADFEEPVAAAGQRVIRVTGCALSHITKSRASGAHHGPEGRLPLIPGVDGTGITAEGERVYFLAPEAPYGGMAEWCLVDAGHLFALPNGLDESLAAAMAIPGMSSWAALTERAQLRAGETVLINGATGTSGRLAIQIARHLGAKRIIATGRRASEEMRALGADVVVRLVEDRKELEEVLKPVFERGVDVVLDYLWGPSAETLMIAAAKAGQEGVPIRYVEIGAISGSDIHLPGAVLRSSSLALMGSGMGSVSFSQLLEAARSVLHAAPAANFKAAIEVVPLAEVGRVWSSIATDARIVLVP